MKYQKGQSGNPRGKPKGTISIINIIRKELKRRVKVVEEGRETKVQLAKVIARKIIKKAVQDEDVKMLIELLNRIDGAVEQSVALKEPIKFVIVDGSKGDENISNELECES